MEKISVLVKGGPHDGELWYVDADLVHEAPKAVYYETGRIRIDLERTPLMVVTVPHDDGYDWSYRVYRENVAVMEGSWSGISFDCLGRDPFEAKKKK